LIDNGWIFGLLNQMKLQGTSGSFQQQASDQSVSGSVSPFPQQSVQSFSDSRKEIPPFQQKGSPFFSPGGIGFLRRLAGK